MSVGVRGIPGAVSPGPRPLHRSTEEALQKTGMPNYAKNLADRALTIPGQKKAISKGSGETLCVSLTERLIRSLHPFWVLTSSHRQQHWGYTFSKMSSRECCNSTRTWCV